MASYSPPSEQLPIFDNEVFSNNLNGSTILTVAQANLLYLRKTFADTATALETFTAGIKTNTIDALGTSFVLNIGSNSAVVQVSKPITLNYLPSLLTGSSVLGYKNAGTINIALGASVFFTGVGQNIYTVNLASGVWLIVANAQFNTPGSLFYLSISQISSAVDFSNLVSVALTSTYTGQITRIINTDISGTGNYFFVGQTSNNTTCLRASFDCYRIA
jgi:hypothetical protein